MQLNGTHCTNTSQRSHNMEKWQVLCKETNHISISLISPYLPHEDVMGPFARFSTFSFFLFLFSSSRSFSFSFRFWCGQKVAVNENSMPGTLINIMTLPLKIILRLEAKRKNAEDKVWQCSWNPDSLVVNETETLHKTILDT